MNTKFYTASVLSAALFLAACDGDDGVNGADGTDGFNSLVAFRDIPKGDAVCLGGGRALDSGLDTNRNDILDSDEVTATEIVECEATPLLRALHASPDAPAVNIFVNGAEALSGVDYGQGSGFLPVAEENTVAVEAIIPDGNATVINAAVDLDYNFEASVLAIGNVGSMAGIYALPIVNPSDSRITEGYFRAQVVHAAPSVDAVHVFVTEFDADLSGSAPVNGAMTPLAFEDYTDRLEVPEGDYQIRITVDGDATFTPVFDSGEIPLAAGADLMIVAIENTGPGNAPVELVVLDGMTATSIKDINTPASAVAVHLSPDAPAVDILADVNSTPDNEAIPLVRNVAFGEFCDLNAVPAPGDYKISVVANADNSVVATDFDLVVDQGSEATAIVSGFLFAEPTILALPQGDDRRSVVTETKLRVTHASPSTGLVDIYLVAAGTDIGGVDPAFEDVPFGADTMQLSIANDMYDAYVTAADSKTPAISLPGLDFTAGGAVLNVVARDLEAGGLDPVPLIIDYNAVPACPAP